MLPIRGYRTPFRKPVITHTGITKKLIFIGAAPGRAVVCILKDSTLVVSITTENRVIMSLCPRNYYASVSRYIHKAPNIIIASIILRICDPVADQLPGGGGDVIIPHLHKSTGRIRPSILSDDYAGPGVLCYRHTNPKIPIGLISINCLSNLSPRVVRRVIIKNHNRTSVRPRTNRCSWSRSHESKGSIT